MKGSKYTMSFEHKFFEAEVRDGFYIPSEVKRSWAAEIDVLQEIDRICKKHDIKYFADWGTLLGIVRHRGYIPWDDDLDISMKRSDYEKFLEVAPQEFKDEFTIYTYKTNHDYWNFVARVVAKDRMCFEQEYLDAHHQFPYIVGVDIFVLDYVAADKSKENERVTIAKFLISLADDIDAGVIAGAMVEENILKVEQMLGISINRELSVHDLRVQLYDLAEQLFAWFDEAEACALTRMMPNGLYYGNLNLPIEYYKEQLWLPFENILLPVPIAYDAMLKDRYGNYMKIVKNVGGHDYPFFDSQRKSLENLLGEELPHYRFEHSELQRKASEGTSIKELASQLLDELNANINSIEEIICHQNVEFKHSIEEPLCNILQVIQGTAIDLGTAIEDLKGQGSNTVTELESLCEAIYNLHQIIVNGDYLSIVLDDIKESVARVKLSVNEEILTRKEIVFITSSADSWNIYNNIWKNAIANSEVDVFVIAIPYYHKRYDGSFYKMYYDISEYPDYLNVIEYDKFNFELHHPDIIYINNPYDNIDSVMSVHPFFYSDNLQKYTDNLYYVPYFILDEFTKESERDYKNMKYYCTTPVVIRADKVILQSENMKSLYVEKLTEFAGENTKDIWENKIIVDAAVSDEYGNTRKDINDIPDEWKDIIVRTDGTRKKVILYYLGISTWIQYKEKILDKLYSNLDIFSKSKDHVALILHFDGTIKDELLRLEPELFMEYNNFIKKITENTWFVLGSDSTLKPECQIADAYYGDNSPLVREFQRMNKPVMIQNVEI